MTVRAHQWKLCDLAFTERKEWHQMGGGGGVVFFTGYGRGRVGWWEYLEKAPKESLTASLLVARWFVCWFVLWESFATRDFFGTYCSSITEAVPPKHGKKKTGVCQVRTFHLDCIPIQQNKEDLRIRRRDLRHGPDAFLEDWRCRYLVRDTSHGKSRSFLLCYSVLACTIFCRCRPRFWHHQQLQRLTSTFVTPSELMIAGYLVVARSNRVFSNCCAECFHLCH